MTRTEAQAEAERRWGYGCDAIELLDGESLSESGGGSGRFLICRPGGHPSWFAGMNFEAALDAASRRAP